MGVLSLFVINKAGGLIYSKDFASLPNMSANDYLRVASMFHSLHAISQNIAPIRSGGIEVLSADTFNICCFRTATNIKFLLVVEPSTLGSDTMLKGVYDRYVEYVLKNPFYEVDMPIRCELFDVELEKLVAEANAR